MPDTLVLSHRKQQKPNFVGIIGAMIDYLGESRRFDVSGIKHPRIEKYKPTFEGAGGYQIVYGSYRFPDRVLKVDARDLLLSIDADYRSYNDAKDQGDILDREGKRFEDLKAVFGANHVLNQSVQLVKMPISKEYIKDVAERYGGNIDIPDIDSFIGDQVWTIAIVQERTGLLTKPGRLSLTGGYAEQRPILTDHFVESYGRLTNSTVIEPKTRAKVDPKELSMVQQHMQGVMQEMGKDELLKVIVTDFVKKAVEYTQKTGEILDIAGKDNVIFYKNDEGVWTYKLIDAMFPANGHAIIKEAKEAFENFSKNGPDSVESVAKGILYNTINYVRTINGLAGILGVSERVDISPSEFRHDPTILLDYFRD